MKRKIIAIAMMMLLLLLCGCGGKNAVYTLDHADELLASGAFEGSEMEAVDKRLVSVLYGIDEEKVTECAVYIAADAWTSADELVVLILTDEQAAIDAEAACRVRIKAQLEVCGMYAPAAVPRLENAFIGRRGNTVLMAVGDPEIIASIKSIH